MIGPTLFRTTFPGHVFVYSYTALMVQREPPQAVWYHLALLFCTMDLEVKRRGVQESKISITPNNITLLTVVCPPRWCIQQTQPSVSLGLLVQLQFFIIEERSNIYIYIYTQQMTESSLSSFLNFYVQFID